MTAIANTLRAPSVVLLDVDGTLLNYRAELPESAASALAAAQARGHRIYLCTGRSRAEVYPQLWDLGIDGLIGGNGSYVEHQGETVFHQVLDLDVVGRAVDWLGERDLGFYLECNSGLFGSDNLPVKIAALLDGPTEENLRFIAEAMPDLIFDTSAGHDDVNKISFVLEPTVDLDQLASEFAGVAKIDTWSLTGNGPEFGEIGQLNIHKGAAVERLADHLQVDPAELIAFGDARSDLELLTTCGTGVAMGNAPDELKQVATLVTDHVDADGLANAFVRLGLVEAVDKRL